MKLQEASKSIRIKIKIEINMNKKALSREMQDFNLPPSVNLRGLTQQKGEIND